MIHPGYGFLSENANLPKLVKIMELPLLDQVRTSFKDG